MDKSRQPRNAMNAPTLWHSSRGKPCSSRNSVNHSLVHYCCFIDVQGSHGAQHGLGQGPVSASTHIIGIHSAFMALIPKDYSVYHAVYPPTSWAVMPCALSPVPTPSVPPWLCVSPLTISTQQGRLRPLGLASPCSKAIQSYLGSPFTHCPHGLPHSSEGGRTLHRSLVCPSVPLQTASFSSPEKVLFPEKVLLF